VGERTLKKALLRRIEYLVNSKEPAWARCVPGRGDGHRDPKRNAPVSFSTKKKKRKEEKRGRMKKKTIPPNPTKQSNPAKPSKMDKVPEKKNGRREQRKAAFPNRKGEEAQKYWGKKLTEQKKIIMRRSGNVDTEKKPPSKKERPKKRKDLRSQVQEPEEKGRAEKPNSGLTRESRKKGDLFGITKEKRAPTREKRKKRGSRGQKGSRGEMNRRGQHERMGSSYTRVCRGRIRRAADKNGLNINEGGAEEKLRCKDSKKRVFGKRATNPTPGQRVARVRGEKTGLKEGGPKEELNRLKKITNAGGGGGQTWNGRRGQPARRSSETLFEEIKNSATLPSDRIEGSKGKPIDRSKKEGGTMWRQERAKTRLSILQGEKTGE